MEQDWVDSYLRHFDNQFVFLQGVHVDGMKFSESAHSHFVIYFNQSGINIAITQTHSWVKCTTLGYRVDDGFSLWIFEELKLNAILLVVLTKQEHFSIPSLEQLSKIPVTLFFSDFFNGIINTNPPLM